MNIEELKDLIQRYLSGKASDQENEWISRWLNNAEHDARETADTGEYALIKEQILTRLRQQYVAPQRKLPGRTIHWVERHWMSIAASLTAVVMIVAGYSERYALLDIIDPIPQTTVRTSAYQVKQVILPDSSRVILNASTSITFPERFRGDWRKIALQGEAYFDIKRDTLRVFTVEAGEMEVKVLGTSFVVSNSSAQREAYVMVQSGKVSVLPEQQDAALLLPGDVLQYDKHKKTKQLRQDIEVDTRWLSHQLVFKETNLADVLHAVEETFGVRIQTKEKDVLSFLFSGSFERKDSLLDVLKILELSYDLTIKEDTNGTILISRKRQ